MSESVLAFQSGSFHIRQLTESESPLYKAMRIESIQTEPTLFRQSTPPEIELSDRDWAERIRYPRIVFGLFEDEKMIGITSMLLLNKEEAYFGQSFIQPQYRKLGLSSLLYKIRMVWAIENQLRKLTISHREINMISKAAIRKAGFHYSHKELVQWLDGTSGYSMYYSLLL
ncbi:GNAT family N-acetyltransferase [Sphingobacterium sp. UGAL515B_05]|uniref:GNAT family N-acetyltransferase n=1 Tax=Sphingobacterium sp. UGAL515B_05 TaxID=2986767 RepID=UPI002953BFCB|nr:GNAT family N-acetyltransferase [Sphingobacterium sp. UGAL515B_05]WON92364.1 GNAT family N-acetyltransferase [Sphingobacterium sp. UGAL515B_05]